jgi:hypothetical protein
LREYFGTGGARNSSPCAQEPILYGIENFSGILADNIRQDFYTAMTLANIAAGLYEEAQEGGKGNKKNDKRRKAMFEEIIELLRSRLIPIRLTGLSCGGSPER